MLLISCDSRLVFHAEYYCSDRAVAIRAEDWEAVAATTMPRDWSAILAILYAVVPDQHPLLTAVWYGSDHTGFFEKDCVKKCLIGMQNLAN